MIGRLASRRPWVLLTGWTVLIVVGALLTSGVIGDGLFARLSTARLNVPGEGREGQEQIARANPSGQATMMLVQRAPESFAVATEITDAARRLSAIPGVAGVSHPYQGDPATASTMANQQARSLLLVVNQRPGLTGAEEASSQQLIEQELASLSRTLAAAHPGLTTEVLTPDTVGDALNHQIEQDLRAGELVALPLSLLLMVLVFGGFIAAGLPIIGALASIVGALTCLLIISHLTDLDATVVNVVSVLGLGLCIDYGLLMVSRFREELRNHNDGVEDALIATCRSAGLTVVYSALTVALSLSALALFKTPILVAVGAAGVSVVLVAMLVATTLVPALIGLAGTRMITPGPIRRIPGLRRLLNAFGDVAPPEGVFSRLARRVQRHPWLVTIGVAALLCVLASPVLGIKMRSSGIELLPSSSHARQVYETVRRDFPATQAPPITILAKNAGDTAAMTAWGKRLGEQVPGIESVLQGALPDGRAMLRVRPVNPDSGSPEAGDIVRDIRAQREVDSWVTGEAAGLVDFTDDLRDRGPVAVLALAAAAFVLLFMMTGSVLIPIKALLMNALSLSATLGILVWGFQDGHLARGLGFTSLGGLESIIPPFMFAFGFGLAMDYEVFLLSRIKEAHDAGMSSDDAVAVGLQRSGRIITSAALIIVIVFLGFASGKMFMIKQMGVALAIAVALDATLVRMLLVPGTMTLLGRANWWAPPPLRRFHERFGITH